MSLLLIVFLQIAVDTNKYCEHYIIGKLPKTVKRMPKDARCDWLIRRTSNSSKVSFGADGFE